MIAFCDLTITNFVIVINGNFEKETAKHTKPPSQAINIRSKTDALSPAAAGRHRTSNIEHHERQQQQHNSSDQQQQQHTRAAAVAAAAQRHRSSTTGGDRRDTITTAEALALRGVESAATTRSSRVESSSSIEHTAHATTNLSDSRLTIAAATKQQPKENDLTHQDKLVLTSPPPKLQLLHLQRHITIASQAEGESQPPPAISKAPKIRPGRRDRESTGHRQIQTVSSFQSEVRSVCTVWK